MTRPETTEQEFVEKIAGSLREGTLRNAFRRAFGFGMIAGLVWLLIAAATFFAYLRLGGTRDDWRFVFGVVIGTLLCPAIFLIGISLARFLRDASLRDTRPYALMIKYHDRLVREGLDPYEDDR